MDISPQIVTRFESLEKEGRQLLRSFGSQELTKNAATSTAWILAARNLLGLSFANDTVFVPAFESADSFIVKVEVLAAAGKELSAGLAGNALRINYLRIAYSDLANEAQSLLDEKFLRCAALVSRVSLERQLRELSLANSIVNSDTKKASALNDELWKLKVYSKGVWSEVSSWLTIGNEAAHVPDFESKYSAAEVQKVITSIKSFVTKP